MLIQKYFWDVYLLVGSWEIGSGTSRAGLSPPENGLVIWCDGGLFGVCCCWPSTKLLCVIKNVIMFYQVLRHKRFRQYFGGCFGSVTLTRSAHHTVWCSKQVNLCSLEGKSHLNPLLVLVQDTKVCTGTFSLSFIRPVQESNGLWSFVFQETHSHPGEMNWSGCWPNAGLIYSETTLSWLSCCGFLLNKLLSHQKIKAASDINLSCLLISLHTEEFFISALGLMCCNGTWKCNPGKANVSPCFCFETSLYLLAFRVELCFQSTSCYSNSRLALRSH